MKCTFVWGARLLHPSAVVCCPGVDIFRMGQSVIAYEFATGDATQCAVTETRTCSRRESSDNSFQYPGCTEGPPPPTTCTTTVTGQANNKDDNISLGVLDAGVTSEHVCTVASNRAIQNCAVTTGIEATITVFSSGSVNDSQVLLNICGTQVVNF
jgi:hypothetical protein